MRLESFIRTVPCLNPDHFLSVAHKENFYDYLPVGKSPLPTDGQTTSRKPTFPLDQNHFFLTGQNMGLIILDGMNIVSNNLTPISAAVYSYSKQTLWRSVNNHVAQCTITRQQNLPILPILGIFSTLCRIFRNLGDSDRAYY